MNLYSRGALVLKIATFEGSGFLGIYILFLVAGDVFCARPFPGWWFFGFNPSEKYAHSSDWIGSSPKDRGENSKCSKLKPPTSTN